MTAKITRYESTRLEKITDVINGVLTEYSKADAEHVAIDVGNYTGGLFYVVVLKHQKAVVLSMDEIDAIRNRLSEIGIYLDGISSRNKKALELFLRENVDVRKQEAMIDKELDEEEKKK